MSNGQEFFVFDDSGTWSTVAGARLSVVGARSTLVGARSTLVGGWYTLVGARSTVAGTKLNVVSASSTLVSARSTFVGAYLKTASAWSTLVSACYNRNFERRTSKLRTYINFCSFNFPFTYVLKSAGSAMVISSASPITNLPTPL